MSRTVLLVEDDPLTRKLFRVALSGCGYQVLEAIDARQARQLLRSVRFDLALVDLRLPDGSGVDLAREVAAEPRTAALPLVAVSGISSTLSGAHREEDLFIDYLLKPVEPSKLVSLAQVYAPLDADDESPRRRFEVVVADDDDLHRGVLTMHLRRAGMAVRTASSGAEALRLVRAERADAIVADLLMPQTDGIGLCRQVTNDPALSSIPVVLVAAEGGGPLDIMGLQAVGAAALLPRTPDPADLIETVIRAIEGARPAHNRSDPNLAAVQDADYRGRVLRRLERQASIASELARVSTLQAAQLSVLAGVSEALQSGAGLADVLRAAAARCLDVSAITLVAAFLDPPQGGLHLVAVETSQGGPPAAERFAGREQLLDALVHGDDVVALPLDGPHRGSSRQLMEDLGCRSLVAIPLAVGSRPLGLILLGASDQDLSRQGFAFARTIQGQLSQAGALAQTMAKLADSQRRFHQVAESMGDGLAISAADGSLVYANPRARSLLGLRRGEESELSALLAAEGPVPEVGEWEAGVCRFPDRTVRVNSSELTGDPDSAQRAHVIVDATKRRFERARLREEARRDPLTGLLNRRGLGEALSRVSEELADSETGGALLYIDLDGFKAINDQLGHAAGDQVLKELGERLVARLRSSDISARVGGDEFAVVHRRAGRVEATGLAVAVRDVVRQVARAEWLAGQRLSASVGVALFPVPGLDADKLMERADAAMYAAKRAGGDQVVFWSQVLEDRVSARS